jgi:hypothetical protein
MQQKLFLNVIKLKVKLFTKNYITISEERERSTERERKKERELKVI